jgi:hypothetical protein
MNAGAHLLFHLWRAQSVPLRVRISPLSKAQQRAPKQIHCKAESCKNSARARAPASESWRCCAFCALHYLEKITTLLSVLNELCGWMCVVEKLFKLPGYGVVVCERVRAVAAAPLAACSC